MSNPKNQEPDFSSVDDFSDDFPELDSAFSGTGDDLPDLGTEFSEAGMDELTSDAGVTEPVSSDLTDKKGQKKKKEKPPKVKKEKAPKVKKEKPPKPPKVKKAKKEKPPKAPRDPNAPRRPLGELIALSAAGFLAVIFIGINALTIMYHGLGFSTIMFLILADLIAATIIAVPILIAKFSNQVSIFEVSLGLAVVALSLGTLLLLAEWYRYDFSINKDQTVTSNHLLCVDSSHYG